MRPLTLALLTATLTGCSLPKPPPHLFQPFKLSAGCVSPRAPAGPPTADAPAAAPAPVPVCSPAETDVVWVTSYSRLYRCRYYPAGTGTPVCQETRWQGTPPTERD